MLDVFAAVEQYCPHRTPGAVSPPEREAIRQDITVPGWSMRIDSLKTTSPVAGLRHIYADHWLVRRLAETEDILSTGAALNAAFDVERQRVNTRVKRLTRSRNAAIYGGSLSDAACGTIADFATALARQAVTTTIWAIVTGQQADAHATSRRDEFLQRIQKLNHGGADIRSANLDSQLTDLNYNADGSIDLYIGAKAPAGCETNYMQTVGDDGWFVLFRLYAPLQPFFDKTFRLPDFEIVD